MKARRKTSSAEKAALLRIFEGPFTCHYYLLYKQIFFYNHIIRYISFSIMSRFDQNVKAEDGNLYPSKEQRLAISQQLRMSPRQVQVRSGGA